MASTVWAWREKEKKSSNLEEGAADVGGGGDDDDDMTGSLTAGFSSSTVGS